MLPKMTLRDIRNEVAEEKVAVPSTPNWLTNIQTQKVGVQPQLALPMSNVVEQKATNWSLPIKELVFSSLGGIVPVLLDKMEGVKGKQQHFVLIQSKNSGLPLDECFTSSIKGSTGIGGPGKVRIQGGSV